MRTEADILEPWQEPPRGRAMDMALFALPGLQAMRTSMVRGDTPPIGRLTGMRPIAVDEGSCTFEMPASEWLLGPKGVLHTGMLAFLADAPLGSAVLAALPARTPITTAELSMTFLGEPPPAGGMLTAVGKLVHVDESNGLSEVFVRDPTGRLVAHGTSRCFIFPQIELPEDLAFADPVPDEAHELPDPFLRPLPEVAIVAPPIGLSGLEIMRAAIDGRLPLPPIDSLTGIRPVEASAGCVTFTMPASGWFMNPAGTMYGGIIACLAKSASSGAVQTIAPVGTAFTALDVKVNYLRPGVVGGGELVATGTVFHRGRKLAIARAEVVQDGKQVAVATGSTALRS